MILKKFEDLTDDDAVVVCNPTEEHEHVKDVTVRQCDFCGRDIWLAESTKPQLPEKYYLACIFCAAPSLQKEVVKMPSDEQLRDVAKNAGVSFEEVKARIHSILNARNKSVKFKQRAEKFESN